ncbi:DUF3732 domain-containing protein [Mycolicibacterium sediminis]|uniref:DUF3732 domain-containing protein n=1 Tax=Mycolicibacterium sediminis TaxID=1286180 RepID=UPI0013D40171|nr:DUF3732 domain-containing protein [Mycolicibacterium sediminis]
MGDASLGPPNFNDLMVNADTDVLRDSLSERLGIEHFTIEHGDGSLRSSFDVSIRQALFYCFQKQSEIASQDILFHRQVDDDLRVTIRETLPYFVGSSSPEQAALYRQLVAARRNLQRLQGALRRANEDVHERDRRVSALVRSAVSLRVLRDDQVITPDQTADVLNQILQFRPDDTDAEGEPLSDRQIEIHEENRLTRVRLRELDDQIEVLTRLQTEQSSSGVEAGIQLDRLRALDLMLPKGSGKDEQAVSCPLCDQTLVEPDETITDLRLLFEELQRRLNDSRGSQTRRGSVIEQLRAARNPMLTALRENAVELEAIAQQEAAVAAGRELRERVAFLQGRVTQELDRGVEIDQSIGELRSSERRARGQLARLEELYDQDNPEAALRSTMDAISAVMTEYARFLELEGSRYFVRLDPVQLTVAVQEPNRRVPLQRMGSAENWVGYHLVAHLALHRWFVTQSRPVPRFLMFDQPTQAFFPEEVVDAANDENADWEAVRRQFTLMRDVVGELGGELQIIVCDHANLADDWFQDAVIDNWRNGEALIPEAWIDD